MRAANPPEPLAARYTLYPVIVVPDALGGFHASSTWCGFAVPLRPIVTVELEDELLEIVN